MPLVKFIAPVIGVGRKNVVADCHKVTFAPFVQMHLHFDSEQQLLRFVSIHKEDIEIWDVSRKEKKCTFILKGISNLEIL